MGSGKSIVGNTGNEWFISGSPKIINKYNKFKIINTIVRTIIITKLFKCIFDFINHHIIVIF